MTGNEPEPDDVIGTEHPRASFEDFAESAADRLVAAARLVTGPDADPAARDVLAGELLARVLERAGRRWWWLTRGGRDPEPPVLRMLVRASGRRDLPDLGHLEQAAAAGRRDLTGLDHLGQAADAGRRDLPGLDHAEQAAAGRAGQSGGWSAADLLAAVHRQQARHKRRLLACGVAAVVVLAAAAWPVTSALRGGQGPGSHPAAGASHSPLISAVTGLGSVPGPPPFGPVVTRAPGTVLRECADANDGDLSKYWRSQSVRAGPVWFVFARTGFWRESRRLARGRLAAQGAVVAIRAGQRAVVRVTGPDRARFRFLAGFNTTDVYSPRGGQPGLTLGGCPSLFTMFWEGYISTLRCVPLAVRTLPHGRVVHVTLPGSSRPCRSR